MLVCIDRITGHAAEARRFAEGLCGELTSRQIPNYFCALECPWGAPVPLVLKNDNCLPDFPECQFHLRQLRRQMQYLDALVHERDVENKVVVVEGGLYAFRSEWQETYDIVGDPASDVGNFHAFGFEAIRPHARNHYWKFISFVQRFKLVVFCTNAQQDLKRLAYEVGLEAGQLHIARLDLNLKNELQLAVKAIHPRF